MASFQVSELLFNLQFTQYSDLWLIWPLWDRKRKGWISRVKKPHCVFQCIVVQNWKTLKKEANFAILRKLKVLFWILKQTWKSWASCWLYQIQTTAQRPRAFYVSPAWRIFMAKRGCERSKTCPISCSRALRESRSCAGQRSVATFW